MSPGGVNSSIREVHLLIERECRRWSKKNGKIKRVNLEGQGNVMGKKPGKDDRVDDSAAAKEKAN